MYAGPDEWYFFATADPLRDEQITVIAGGIPNPDTPLVCRISVDQASLALELARGSMPIHLPSIPVDLDTPPDEARRLIDNIDAGVSRRFGNMGTYNECCKEDA